MLRLKTVGLLHLPAGYYRADETSMDSTNKVDCNPCSKGLLTRVLGATASTDCDSECQLLRVPDPVSCLTVSVSGCA